MSTAILGFDKRFEKLAKTSEDHQYLISMMRQRLDTTDSHQACNISRMNVLDKIIEELENTMLPLQQ
jgi:hypothetical protein